MAAVTIKGLSGAAGDGAPLQVMRATITMPRTGAWYGYLTVDTQRSLTGKVEIAAGSILLRGTVNRAGRVAGLTRLRVVGGADGLRKKAKPKHYQGPTVQLVMGDLARDAGEVLAATSDRAVLTKGLVAWTTFGIETGAMVAALVATQAAAAAVWRILPDGTLWVGVDTWAAAGVGDYVEIENRPEDGVVIFGMDVPRLVPGTTIGTRKIDCVEHEVTAEGYRAKVLVAE